MEFQCRCKNKMEWVGCNFGDRKFWCPKCGRYIVHYACDPPKWRTPEITIRKEMKNKSIQTEKYQEGKVKLQGIRPEPKTEKPDLTPFPQKLKESEIK